MEDTKRSLFKYATIYLQGTAWVRVGYLGAFQKHGFRAKQFKDYNGGRILVSFRKCYSKVFFRVIRFSSVKFKRNTSRSAVWIGFIECLEVIPSFIGSISVGPAKPIENSPSLLPKNERERVLYCGRRRDYAIHNTPRIINTTCGPLRIVKFYEGFVVDVTRIVSYAALYFSAKHGIFSFMKNDVLRYLRIKELKNVELNRSRMKRALIV